jgi:hypothetical protein
MRKSVVAVFSAILAFTPLVASAGDGPNAVPSLSGDYVLTLINNCVQSGSSVSQTTATATFDADAGTLSFSGFVADGNPIVLTPVTGSGAYSNTKTTVVFAGTTYKAFYGATKKGVAQYVSMIAIVAGGSGNCANQATLVHQ